MTDTPKDREALRDLMADAVHSVPWRAGTIEKMDAILAALSDAGLDTDDLVAVLRGEAEIVRKK